MCVCMYAGGGYPGGDTRGGIPLGGCRPPAGTIDGNGLCGIWR